MRMEFINNEALDDDERKAIEGMPVDVTIGYLKAKRKDEGRTTVINGPLGNIFGSGSGSIGDIFGGLFGK